MSRLNVLSNVDLTAYDDGECRFEFDPAIVPGRGAGLAAALKLLRTDVDAILVFHGDAALMGMLAAYKAIGGRAKIFYFDLLLAKPTTAAARARALVKSLLLRAATRYICVHRDTRDYERYYRLDARKIAYVPFKANCYELRDAYPTSDGGYVLSCGASYRDYDTLLRAAGGLPIPIKIVLPAEDAARHHNTRLTAAGLPANVEIVRHDFDRTSWYRLLAAATLVVLPIARDAIQPAGISVYLEAMSMGKPVIVSECPATTGILDRSSAWLVPRGDEEALRRAIVALWNDRDAREELSANGRAYADSLGGVRRLVADLSAIVSGDAMHAR